MEFDKNERLPLHSSKRFEFAKRQIRRAIKNKDTELLEDAAFELDLYLVMPKRFPNEVFDFLLKTLQSSSCLKMKKSHHLLYLFTMNREKLTKKQKGAILHFIETCYADFTDWMSWFVISELLGEYFSDKDSFEVLCALQKTKKAHPRSFVAHGFEHIIRDSGNQQLAALAFTRLMEMKKDRSKRVRYEVQVSLARVRARGLLQNEE